MHPETGSREHDFDEGPILEDKESGGPEIGADLSVTQKTWLYWLVEEFKDVFDEKHGMVHGVEHHMVMPLGCIMRDHWRRLPMHLFKAVKRARTNAGVRDHRGVPQPMEESNGHSA